MDSNNYILVCKASINLLNSTICDAHCKIHDLLYHRLPAPFVITNEPEDIDSQKLKNV